MSGLWPKIQAFLAGGILWRALEVLLAILLIALLAGVAIRVCRATVDRIFRVPEDSGPSGSEEERRAKTLNHLVKSFCQYGISFIAGMAILDQMGVDTRSLLAAAGILGLAVGFGAQNLVRDVVTGFFILSEDQFAVGDYITAAGVSGIVETVGIRVTRLRDLGGELHIIPNGRIEQVTNHMGPGMRLMFTVRIPYEEDVDRVIAVLEELFAELRTELENIVEGPSVLGVQDFGPAGVELLVWGRAKAMTQWATGREIRRRIKQRFDELNIEIPYPRNYVIVDERPRRKGVGGDSDEKGREASGPGQMPTSLEDEPTTKP